MPARKSQFQMWYEQIKRELLISEPQNILSRALCCQNIINECLMDINMSLCLPTLTPSQQYKCKVIPKDHLKFLLNWPGLRSDNSPKAPKTKKEYEKKSKNWLNGRRAPNYGKTLFPFFVSDAENYVLQTCKLLINDNDVKQKLYYDIVIYKILAHLCGCTVSLHEQAKKAPFFCKNSIERKGKLKVKLQSYAPDHEYIQGFPSCYEEAIGYFERKSNLYFHRYREQNLGYIAEKSTDRKSIKSDFCKTHNNVSARVTSHRSQVADAEYWKKQFLDLKRELTAEREIRINVERERDTLTRLINTNSDNMMHNLCLPNNNTAHSMDSLNGSSTTVSTANVCHVANNMPSIQPSHQSNINSLHYINGDNKFCAQPFNNFCANGMNILNTSQPSFPISHGQAMGPMNGINNMSHMNNNNINLIQPSLNKMSSDDAFDKIIDSMPVMSIPQISNEYYSDNMLQI